MIFESAVRLEVEEALQRTIFECPGQPSLKKPFSQFSVLSKPPNIWNSNVHVGYIYAGERPEAVRRVRVGEVRGLDDARGERRGLRPNDRDFE